MSMTFIDISNHQKGINLASVLAHTGGVIVKATEGTGFVDAYCDGFVQVAKAKGKPWGFYHFAGKASGREEAAYFLNHTSNYFGLGIPVLDWEGSSDGTFQQPVSWVNDFVRTIHDQTGVWPWIYGNPWRFNEGGVEANCGRWVAGYPLNNNTNPEYGLDTPIPYDVDGLICAWQFTSSGRLSGYAGNLDCNVFYGDTSAWEAYAKASATKPTVSVPEKKPETSKPTQSTAAFKVGDKVTFAKAVDENGTKLAVSGTYTVMEVSGSRVVVGRGGVVTAAVPASNLRKASSSATSAAFKVGDKVTFAKTVDENGTKLAVSGTYTVMEVSGSRVVVGRGGVVTAAVPAANLRKA